MRIFRRTLSLLYFIGFLLHVADFFNFRLHFSEMDNIWKAWIIFLMVADVVASIGLWKDKLFGDVVFILVAISQLIAYLFFKDFFGEQMPLVVFHFITLFIYFLLRKINKN